jgi:putative flavoprotein involved in K+ transport
MSNKKIHKVIIIGGGPAGIGVATTLKDFGISDVLIFEKGKIGETFRRWTKETKLLTPSFVGNQFGAIDLNAVHPSTSPAFSFHAEHLSGAEYADYLCGVVNNFHLSVREECAVSEVTKEDGIFHVKTSKGMFFSQYVIFAQGEFGAPVGGGVDGSEHCVHVSSVSSWGKLRGDTFVIIGGYESGIDAGINLAGMGKRAVVIDARAPWEIGGSDPSRMLSPYTKERLRNALKSKKIKLIPHSSVVSVSKNREGYAVEISGGKTVRSLTRPILASGYSGAHPLMNSLFTWRKDGDATLSVVDESTVCPGVFLAGPKVRQEELIFCFIYKFRQRFAVVANEIATRERLDTTSVVLEYKRLGMFLDDCSHCEDECAC